MGKGQKKNQQFSQKQVPDLVVKKATVRAKKLKLSEQSVQKFTRITRVSTLTLLHVLNNTIN